MDLLDHQRRSNRLLLLLISSKCLKRMIKLPATLPLHLMGPTIIKINYPLEDRALKIMLAVSLQLMKKRKMNNRSNHRSLDFESKAMVANR